MKKPFKCEVSGRVCPFTILDFLDFTEDELSDSCPTGEYHGNSYFVRTETGIAMSINSECVHAITRKLMQTEEENRMKISKACTIFESIDSPDFTDLEKGEAIYEVLKMPTHNSITKDKMLSVIKWLFDKVFEWEETENE